jgi:hypothetical protein
VLGFACRSGEVVPAWPTIYASKVLLAQGLLLKCR